jgi:hypothetical protein
MYIWTIAACLLSPCQAVLPLNSFLNALADTFCAVTVLQEQKEREHEERLKQKQWEAQRGVAQKQAEER